MEWSIAPLLLLGLVAGYVFIQHYEVLRYKVAREDGHKLYFRSAFWGIPVTLATTLLLTLLAKAVLSIDSWQSLQRLFLNFTDSKKELLIAGLVSSPIMAVGYAKLFNLFTNRDKHFQEALKENEFEMLLVTSTYRGMPVMVSMDDRKVYVGFIYKTGDPAKQERAYFSMIPIMSGVRNEQGQVGFTTYYEPIYESGGDEMEHLKVKDFALILPVARLVSARLFDKTAYTKFWETSEPLAKNPPPANNNSTADSHD